MDFIDGLLSSIGKTAILVVVDHLSNYSHFNALSHLYTTVIVAKFFLARCGFLRGMPLIIINDCDSIFLSQFWEEYFQL